MKMKILALTVAMMLVAATAQAVLWDPAIDNPSFESVENGGTPGGWGYVIDDWYTNVTVASEQAYYEQASGIGLVGDGDIWVGTNNAARFYQAIGTYDGDETINISMLLGARGDFWPAPGGVVSIYAGGTEADAGIDVELSGITGVTLLDTITVVPADGTLVSTNVYEVGFSLSTGTGVTPGDLLWLEFGTDGGRGYFDLVQVPEPATMILLGLGGLCLRRRKR